MARNRHRSHGTGTLFKRGGRGSWIAAWYGHDGRRREASTRTTDKAAAERILSKRIADAALRRDGVIDARDDKYTDGERRPLADHVRDWLAALDAKRVTPKQVAVLKHRVDALLSAVKTDRISGLSASAVQTAIGELHTNGRSLRTCHHYLRAIKQFSRWLKRDGRMRDDPLAHLAGYNADTDVRYERRALDADELTRLIDAAAHGPTWRGMTGGDRAMLYRVATGTGFRAAELRSLTPSSFQFDADSPCIVLRASHSKRRREDRQPIRPDLAETLRAWVESLPADVPVFVNMPEKTALMIRADLRRARAAWIREAIQPAERRERLKSEFLSVVDSAGRVADFHALRASYITLLVKAGVSVKVAQLLARHSDPKLTMNTYTRLGVHDLASALEFLPGIAKNANDEQQEPAALRATGSLDHRADAVDGPPQIPQQLGRESVRHGAKPRLQFDEPLNSDDIAEPLQTGGKCDIVRRNATGDEIAPERIRTSDLRFRKPLLYPAELRALGGLLIIGYSILRPSAKIAGAGPGAGRPRRGYLPTVRLTPGAAVHHVPCVPICFNAC